MKIAGLRKCSLIDFPGKIASVVFTQGCDLRCPFCHNPQLWDMRAPPTIAEGEVFSFLRTRRGKLEGVVVSGGEPTLQEDLADFLQNVRGMGFATKLDTNGLRPFVLETLLQNGSLDFVAMDVKHGPAGYDGACGRPVSPDAVQRSLSLLRESKIAYELRTTVVPGIHRLDDLRGLRDLVAGAPRFVLQNFDPRSAADPHLRTVAPFPGEALENLRPFFAAVVGEFFIR